MIAFPVMLVPAAEKAGMSVPPNLEGEEESLDDFKEEFPHFFVFCMTQLCRPMRSLGEHWGNAEVIASIPDEEIREVTIDALIDKGFSISFN